MTPNDIEILLHYHVSPQKHPRLGAPAVVASIRRMVGEGLLESTNEDKVYATTRGAAHVKQLCCLPLPVGKAVWVSSTGEVI